MRSWAKIITVCAALAAPCFLWAGTEEENGDLLSTAFNAIDNKDWVSADHYASQVNDPIAVDLVTWERLRKGEGDWEEYRTFLAANGDWPGLKRLRRKGEAAIPKDANPTIVRSYFEDQLPQTGGGSLRLAEAYAAQGRNGEARIEAIRAWNEMSLKEHEENALYAQYKGVLSRHNLKRLDNLLWRGLTREAGRMLNRVPDENVKLANARIGLQRASQGVDALIGSVPKNLQSDPGLAYDRFQWRVKKVDGMMRRNCWRIRQVRYKNWDSQKRGRVGVGVLHAVPCVRVMLIWPIGWPANTA